MKIKTTTTVKKIFFYYNNNYFCYLILIHILLLVYKKQQLQNLQQHLKNKQIKTETHFLATTEEEDKWRKCETLR